jgi:AraC family transcriptional regulator
VLSSIKSFNGIIGAWFFQDGKYGYMYGIEVPPNYKGEIPEGMECVSYPESHYGVFHHPPYDYNTMDLSVNDAIVKTMESWNPAEHGYAWRNDLPIYQRHNPIKYGQAILKPMKKLG